MKILKYTSIIILFSIALTGCKQQNKESKSDLAKLTINKEKLVKQIDSLSKKLKKIEKQISKLDTLKQLQKVTTYKVNDTIFKHFVSLQGTVASDKNVLLRPEMGGTVQHIFIKEGQRVAKGQILVQLDASTLINKVDELKNQLNLATTTFERQKRLWDQKIGSEMQYLNTKTQKEGLEKSLQSLYTQINKMKIKAPFSGVVDEIFPNVGELTSPQSPIIRLINLNKMYIEADVPETYLKSIKKGTPLFIYFEPINKTIEGKIAEVSNYINPNNRSYKVKIIISNKEHDIKPNMLADLKINDFSAKGIVLPSYLIQMNQEGQSFVYGIDKKEDKTIVSQKILSLGKEYNNHILVKNGLTPEEEIINEGGKFVKDGDEVIID